MKETSYGTTLPYKIITQDYHTILSHKIITQDYHARLSHIRRLLPSATSVLEPWFPILTNSIVY